MADGNVLDTLSIQINADAGNAIKALGTLSTKLARFSKTVSEIGKMDGFTSGVKKASSAIEDMASAINKLDPDKIKAFSSAVNKLASGNMKTACENMPKLAQSIREVVSALDGYTDKADQITRLASALADLSKNASGLKKVSSALNSSSTALVVSENSGNQSADLPGAEEYSTVTDYLAKITTGFDNAGQAASDFGVDMGGAAQEAVDGSEEIKRLTDDNLRVDFNSDDTNVELESIIKLLNKYSRKIMEFWYGITRLKVSVNILKTVGNAFKSMGNVAKKAITPVISGLSKLNSKYNVFQKAFTNGVDFGKFFKNILKYGFGIRSTYILFKKLRSAVVNSFNSLVVFDAELNSAFSNIKSSMSLLSNSTASAIAPLIKAIEPVVVSLINKLVDAINVFGQFMAMVTNKKWYKASYVYQDYAASLDSAADSAKALNAQLQGFDKLNNLTSSSSSGSGSSDSSSGSFEETPVDGKWSDLFRDAWESSDFTQVGDLIGRKLWGAVQNGINWLSTTGKTFGTKLAKCLATLLNGFADAGKLEKGGLAYSIGELIGTAADTAFSSIDEFIDDVEWGDIGGAIARSLNGFLQTGSLSKVSETLADWLNAEFGTLGGFNSNFSFNSLATQIIEALETFFDTFDFKNAGKQFGKFISKLANSFSLILGDKKIWQGLGSGIATGLNSIFDSNLLENIANVIVKGINAAISTIGSFNATFDWSGLVDHIKTSFYDLINGIDWSDAGEQIGTFASNAISSIASVVTDPDMWSSFSDKLSEFFATFFEKMGDVDANGNSAWTKIGGSIGQVASNILQLLIDLLEDNWDEIYQAVTDFFSGLRDSKTFQNLGALIVESISLLIQGSNNSKGVTTGTGIKQNVQKNNKISKYIVDIIKSMVKMGFESAVEAVKELWNESKLGKFFNGEISFFDLFKKETASTSVTQVADSGQVMIDVGLNQTTTNSDVSGWFKNIKTWWGKKNLDVGNKNTSNSSTTNTWWSGLKSLWGNDKKLNVGNSNTTSKATTNGWWSNVQNLWGTPSLSLGLTIPNISTVLSNLWTSIKNNWGTNKSLTVKTGNKASGGAFYNGSWHSIAQYAAGGSPNYGTAFVAGERGPEVVGHIGSRTEVLNESQLASVMYDAVVSGMQVAMANGGGVNVYLEGDAQGLFKAVRKADSNYKKVNGHSAFAY